MNIKDENNLIGAFAESNKNYETPDGVPLEVLLNTVLTNAARTLLSIQKGRTGLYAFRSESTGFAFILRGGKQKKGEKPEPELTAVLPVYIGGRPKAMGVAALEKQIDFFIRDSLKTGGQKINAAKKSHDVVELGDLKVTYWEGRFYDANVIDMIVIK